MRSHPRPVSPSRIRGSLAVAATAVLVTATATACGSGDTAAPTPDSPSSSASSSASSSPTISPSPAQTLSVEVTGDTVSPVARELDLGVGETLRITVTSDRAGELHVHSDPEHTFDFDSGTESFDLVLSTPGSVDVEEHVSDTLVARILVR